ncbi:homeobox protein ESX1-like [Cavia porcellus]|uniref:homeobox protein ESX1-like n=1 Tax=Cavia porcellus TaxID=10141 RepID=UPI002FE33720
MEGPKLSQKDVAPQSLGVLKLRREVQDEKPGVTSVVGSRGDDGKKVPEQRALKGEGDCVTSLAAPGPDNEDKENQESGKLQDVEPVVTSLVVPREEEEKDTKKNLENIPEQEATAGEGLCLDAGDAWPSKEDRGYEQEPGQQQLGEPCLFYDVSSRLQLQQVERIFQRAQYPDVFARKEISIPTCVIEASVSVSSLDKDSSEKPL